VAWSVPPQVLSSIWAKLDTVNKTSNECILYSTRHVLNEFKNETENHATSETEKLNRQEKKLCVQFIYWRVRGIVEQHLTSKTALYRNVFLFPITYTTTVPHRVGLLRNGLKKKERNVKKT